VCARLRHRGARRGQLTAGAAAAVNQVRDLAECAWPAVLAAAGSPFRPVSWRASLAVVPAGAPGTRAGSGGRAWTGSPRRCGGSCPGGAGGGRARGSSGPCSPRWPVPPGPPRTAPGALQRAQLALGDWRDTRARLAGTEARMRAVATSSG